MIAVKYFIRDIVNNKVTLDAIYNNQGSRILYTVDCKFLREINSRDLKTTFEINGYWVCATYNHYCNQIFAINSSDGSVYQWDITTSKVINTYEGSSNCYATSICISNNNQKICIAYKDCSKVMEYYYIKEWDIKTKKLINSF